MAAGTLETPDFRQIVALRIACAGKRGCARPDLKADIFELVSHRLSQGEWNTRLDAHLDELGTAGAISVTPKGRMAITKSGKREAVAYLGLSGLPTRNWNEIVSIYLVAKVLGVKPAAQKRMKTLSSSDGLRALILDEHFNLKFKDIAPTAVQLRNALAVRALRDETFTESHAGLKNGSARIPRNLSLFLASQNLQQPRRIASTEKLIALLAAEAVGAVQPDPKSLRLALVRAFVLPRRDAANGTAGRAEKVAANGTVNGAEKKASPNPASREFDKELDLAKFALSVHELARDRAEGWAGNKRAYISHVWQTVLERRPDWELDEDAFKVKLTEAHRAGHLTLTIADLRDKSNIADVRDSVTRYKNAEWHLIRVED